MSSFRVFICAFHFSSSVVIRAFSLRSFDKTDEWNQAEILMSDYRTILERRENLNSESALMERQNEQLESDLNKHFKEKVNEELRYPPSSMIPVVGEAGKK